MRVSRGFFHSIALWFFHLGGFGLLLLGIIDSSPLSAPLANDLLVAALSASHPDRMIYYAVMAAVGSTLGSLTVDVISRKAESKTCGVESGAGLPHSTPVSLHSVCRSGRRHRLPTQKASLDHCGCPVHSLLHLPLDPKSPHRPPHPASQQKIPLTVAQPFLAVLFTHSSPNRLLPLYSSL